MVFVKIIDVVIAFVATAFGDSAVAGEDVFGGLAVFDLVMLADVIGGGPAGNDLFGPGALTIICRDFCAGGFKK
jgi:hypothetical protein